MQKNIATFVKIVYYIFSSNNYIIIVNYYIMNRGDIYGNQI